MMRASFEATTGAVVITALNVTLPLRFFLFFVFLRFYLLRKCNWDYGTECYPTIEVFFIFYFMFLLTSQVQW